MNIELLELIEDLHDGFLGCEIENFRRSCMGVDWFFEPYKVEDTDGFRVRMTVSSENLKMEFLIFWDHESAEVIKSWLDINVTWGEGSNPPQRTQHTLDERDAVRLMQITNLAQMIEHWIADEADRRRLG